MEYPSEYEKNDLEEAINKRNRKYQRIFQQSANNSGSCCNYKLLNNFDESFYEIQIYTNKWHKNYKNINVIFI